VSEHDDDFDDELDDGNVVDDDFEDDDDTGNRLVGALPQRTLEYIARSIADDPDAIVVEADEERHGVTLRLHVAPDDMGKVIGKRGRTAQNIRTVVRMAGQLEGVDAQVDIVD
jgi:predicted RNA-binding protein YlqC (UPF0109 family)